MFNSTKDEFIKPASTYCSHYVKLLHVEKERSKEVNAIDALKAQENPYIKDQNAKTKISVKLSAIKRLEELEKKRQILFERNFVEIRKLKSDLQIAKIHKNITEHLKHKRGAETRERLRQKKEAQETRRNIIKMAIDDRKKLVEKQQQQLHLRTELQKQIIQNEELGLKAQQIALEEQKKSRADRAQYLLDEQNRKVEIKQTQDKLRHDINQFLLSRKEYQMQENLQMHRNEIHRNIMDAKLMEEKIKYREQKLAKSIQTQIALDQIGRKVFKEISLKHKGAALLSDLIEEEYRYQDMARHKFAQLKSKQNDILLNQDLYEQKLATIQRKQRAKEIDHEYGDGRLDYMSEYFAKQEQPYTTKNDSNKKYIEMEKQVAMLENRKREREAIAKEKNAQIESLINRQKETDEQVLKDRHRLICNEPQELYRFIPWKILNDSEKLYIFSKLNKVSSNRRYVGHKTGKNK